METSKVRLRSQVLCPTLTVNCQLNQLGHLWPVAVLGRAQVVALLALSDIVDGQGAVREDCVSQIFINRHEIPLFAAIGLCLYCTCVRLV